jgi:hypothetical protein
MTAAGLAEFCVALDGVFILQTAPEKSIDANRVIGINEYLWERQQVCNKRYYADLAARHKPPLDD